MKFCDHPPAAQRYVPDVGLPRFRYCFRCRRHWTTNEDRDWIEDQPTEEDEVIE